jgi:2-amino-4-hydroxy-6-hydroxymethyldihydropteridine diphosphokinase
MGTLALISLGSNVGDRLAHLVQAVDALHQNPGVTVVAVSTCHETDPVGGPVGQGPFLNAAARLDTDLDPFTLLDVLLDIEQQAGRVRTVRWGERTLDLDLILYGCKRIHSDRLILPHPGMAVRRFVLAPLEEIAPDVVDMQSGKTIFQLRMNLDDRPSYVALDAAPGSRRDEIFRRLTRELPSIGLKESEIPPGANLDPIDGPEVWLNPGWSPEAQAKVLKLRAGDWRRRLGGDRWLVTDFCESKFVLGEERSRYVRTGPSRSFDPDKEQVSLREWLLDPTFVVAMKGGAYDTLIPREPDGFGPGLSRRTGDVLFFPESDQPADIAREILAACAATRS